MQAVLYTFICCRVNMENPCSFVGNFEYIVDVCGFVNITGVLFETTEANRLSVGSKLKNLTFSRSPQFLSFVFFTVKNSTQVELVLTLTSLMME